MILDCDPQGVVRSSPAEIPWKEHRAKYTDTTYGSGAHLWLAGKFFKVQSYFERLAERFCGV